MFRKLSPLEREQLAAQGVSASDWDAIEVASEGFDATAVQRCHFVGRVCIGPGVRIEDVIRIESEGVTRFGMMTPVAVVNEGGGREVPLHASITAQTAYLMAMYRHRNEAIVKLTALAQVESSSDSGCLIDAGATVVGCGILRNIHIGQHAHLDGVKLLEECTVLGRVGHGVRASHCFFAAGSEVDGSASLKRCLVGGGACVEEGFTAVDSLFFRGSHLGAGEAVSVFAGPYTVSHHKSSLLIAGIFSFFNAGSGANQSNHLFRTGPVHQGVTERGAKFASNAYVMLPARIGAFSVVLGRHASHPDSSDFPYSYITEDQGKSWLLPGATLRSHGTARDLKKWPERDAKLAQGADLVNFAEHNPYIAQKFVHALAIIEQLLAKPADTYTHNRLRISDSMLRRGREIYRQALDASLGAMLASGAQPSPDGAGEWVDMAGMYTPKVLIDKLLDDIDSGKFSDMAALRTRLAEIHAGYASHAASWTIAQLGHTSPAEAIERGKLAEIQIVKAAEKDALKDASAPMATGYGIDAFGDETIVEADFQAVRKTSISE